MKWKAFFIVFEGLWFGAKIKNCWHTAVYGLNVDSFTALPKPATKTVIVGWRWSAKKLIFKILQNSCESTLSILLLKKWHACNLLKTDPGNGVFQWILRNFSEQLFCHIPRQCFYYWENSGAQNGNFGQRLVSRTPVIALF